MYKACMRKHDDCLHMLLIKIKCMNDYVNYYMLLVYLLFYIRMLYDNITVKEKEVARFLGYFSMTWKFSLQNQLKDKG